MVFVRDASTGDCEVKDDFPTDHVYSRHGADLLSQIRGSLRGISKRRRQPA
jgi:hypothetical protein